MPPGKRRLERRTSRGRRLALLAAPLVTVLAVGTGVATTAGPSRTVDLETLARHAVSLSVQVQPQEMAERTGARISRGLSRLAIARPTVTGQRWTLADLNLWTRPSEDSARAGEVAELTRVAVTGNRRAGFAEIVLGGHARWVSAQYLARKKPADPVHARILDQPCAGTSGVESGLTSAAVAVYRAVCNNFPQVTRYGGYDAHGEHSSGRALDIMTSDVGLGTDIAEFLRAHAGELNLFDIIWRQHIWTPVRSAEGWRSMPSRGSTTANHYDHVHVSVN